MRAMSKVLILNGPNLNLLGQREPEIYGSDTLRDIEVSCQMFAANHGLQLEFKQSNHEGQLVDWIQQAKQERVDTIVINPAAYTHTSIAIRDAFLATDIPFIEVHLSDTQQREDFRKHSYLSDIAITVISNLGAQVYRSALETIINQKNG